jgi:hypothetical protein
MTANSASSKLGLPRLGRRHAMRACLAIAVFVLVLASLGAAAARADEPVDPAATTSAEPTPEETPSQEPAPEETSTEEPGVIPESPSPEGPGEGDSGPMGAGTGGGEGGGAATPTVDEIGGAEQAPAEEGTLAAAAGDARDPRASIGDINCTNLTVPVTLDNSRSTEAVIYRVTLDDWGDVPLFDKEVQVPGGATRIVTVPVSENADVAVFVGEPRRENFEPGVLLTFSYLPVDCTDDDPHNARATVGEVDCASMTVPLMLDNSRSEDEATYAVFAITVRGENQDESYFLDQFPATFDVPAGDVRTVPVPVLENSVLDVDIFDDDVAQQTEGEEGFLLREVAWVDCSPGDDPHADIGKVNCTNLTVPVTLDNTQSTVGRALGIGAGIRGHQWETYGDWFPMAAGAVRIVPVPVPNKAKVTVVVAGDDGLGLGYNFAFETMDVDCLRVLAGRAGPRLADGEGALAATGANGLTLPIAGLALMTCGGVLSMLGRRYS